MKQNIVQIIIYLLKMSASQISEVDDPLFDQGALKQRLESAGYSKEMVVSAFDWLRELIEQQCWYAATTTTTIDSGAKTNKTIRIFNFEERARLSLEVRSFILSLEYAGILDTQMREIVINQLIQLNYLLIELVDAKWVVLLVLMSKFNKNIYDIQDYLLAMTALEV